MTFLPSKISLFDEKVEMDSTPPSANKADTYAHLPTVADPNTIQMPYKIEQLFPVNRVNIYMLISPTASHGNPYKVILRRTAPEGPLELQIPVVTLKDPGQTIHQLAARKAIQELEEGRGCIQDARGSDGALLREKHPSRMDELVEREGVKLGVCHQIASKWTSFRRYWYAKWCRNHGS